MSLLAYKDPTQFEYQGLINKENSIKLLFEFNKVLNEHSSADARPNGKGTLQGDDDDDFFTRENINQSLADNNEVSFKITRYEPLLFQEFREFYYKQEFFRDQSVQAIREITG